MFCSRELNLSICANWLRQTRRTGRGNNWFLTGGDPKAIGKISLAGRWQGTKTDRPPAAIVIATDSWARSTGLASSNRFSAHWLDAKISWGQASGIVLYLSG